MDTIQLNITSGNSTDSSSTYDAEGAMKFTVAVVTMYSAGMVGVLVMGFLNGRKHLATMDEQATYFMKDIDRVRVTLEKKERLQSVNKMLETMEIDNKEKNTNIVGSGFLPFVALPVFFGQRITKPEKKVEKIEQKEDPQRNSKKCKFYLGQNEEEANTESNVKISKLVDGNASEINVTKSSIERNKEEKLNTYGHADHIREDLGGNALICTEEGDTEEPKENDSLLNVHKH